VLKQKLPAAVTLSSAPSEFRNEPALLIGPHWSTNLAMSKTTSKDPVTGADVGELPGHIVVEAERAVGCAGPTGVEEEGADDVALEGLGRLGHGR
jgi:hypothetical protein